MKRIIIFFSTLFILTPFLSFPLSLESATQILPAPDPLPHVTSKMQLPEFWTKKIKDPSRVLLKPEDILEMNEKNSGRQDLYLFKVTDLKEEFSKEELLALMKEDWETFGNSGRVRYGREGHPLDNLFWNELKKNLNQEAMKERNPAFFGLAVRRADIRVFPTDERSFATPTLDEFDRFQHSSVSPGSFLGIYSFSKDQRWAYIQTSFVRGWVRKEALAIARERREAIDYKEAKDRLTITGNFVDVYGDPSFQEKAFEAQMGNSFPILSLPENGSASSLSRAQELSENRQTKEPFCVIKIPFRQADGTLSIKKGYIRKGEDVHYGYLPYTQLNVAQQAFKMLNQPYGWGEMSGGRDCSRLIMDLYATFGIVMPRNSTYQARMGIELGEVEGKTTREKKRMLDRALPLATLLRLPGHIMLYLGKHRGKYYVIHSIWGIQRQGSSIMAVERIAKTVVSDLSLGESGPRGSLLDRITDIRVIGKKELELRQQKSELSLTIP